MRLRDSTDADAKTKERKKEIKKEEESEPTQCGQKERNLLRALTRHRRKNTDCTPLSTERDHHASSLPFPSLPFPLYYLLISSSSYQRKRERKKDTIFAIWHN